MEKFRNRRNPLLPLNYHIPDCEGHVMSDGKLYLYGSFDAREDVYCSDKYYVVSTEDMTEWKISDVSLRGTSIPWFDNPEAPKYSGIDWNHPTPFIQKMLADSAEKQEKENREQKKEQPEKFPLLFAPDCIEKNGTYYLYFCMVDDSEGVAVSDCPEGPFENPVQLPCGGIDPAVFLDDDGQAYYYWGQLFSHGVRLNSDMISFDPGKIVDNLVTEETHFFHEGSSVRKIGNTYYYVYTNMERGKPTSLGYATGNSPLGPFVYRGIIIDNEGCDPASWNNHGSIECINGQWYVFYHRCSRGKQLYRRLCAEPIYIQADGTIEEVKMTSQGLGEPFAPGEIIMGYQACGLTGSVYIDADATYEEKLTNISDKDTAVFRYVKSEEGWTRARIKLIGNGIVEILFGDKVAGKVETEKMWGGGSAAQEVIAEIKAPAGMYELTLLFRQPEDLQIISIILE